MSEIEAITAGGFESIIANRPDGEQSDQPASADIEAAARAKGLALRYLPVVSGKVTDDDAIAFRALLAELTGPVFAYCRHLWARACRINPGGRAAKALGRLEHRVAEPSAGAKGNNSSLDQLAAVFAAGHGGQHSTPACTRAAS